MAKKSKPQNKANKGSTSGSAGTSNIFKTLFGDVQENGTSSVSLFSNDNPFRRKATDGCKEPQHPQQGQTQLGVEFRKADEIESREKTKRNGDKSSNLDPNSDGVVVEPPSETRKSRKLDSTSGSDDKELLNNWKKEKDSGLKEISSTEDKENSASGSQREELRDGNTNSDKEKGKKKKRKREEVEAEYEARQYGAMMTSEASEKGKVAGEKRKKMDNPEDTMIPKEGFDDESKLLRTVFVGNLPLRVKKKALFKEFNQFGDIESLRIRSIPILDSKTPRKGAILEKKINDAADSVHAYIVFKIEESALASLANNMAVLGGNHIRVDRACPPRKKLKGDSAPLYDNKRTVFVGNLPLDVKDEEIYQLFCGISNLESSLEAVRVIRDPNTSLGKGIAYVLFKTRDAANMVVKKHNLKLRDRELRLSHAKLTTTSSKRKYPSSTETDHTPSKKLAVTSPTQYQPNTSYQGMRSTKTGDQKKFCPKPMGQTKLKPQQTQAVEMLKERKKKRPSVAARKANALKVVTAGGFGGFKQKDGKKRKFDSMTPDSAGRNKKPRKFRIQPCPRDIESSLNTLF